MTLLTVWDDTDPSTATLRTEDPAEIGGVAVERFEDLLEPGDGAEGEVPPADVLRLWLADGSRVIVRPSGTEPKLKAYLDVRGDSAADAAARLAALRGVGAGSARRVGRALRRRRPRRVRPAVRRAQQPEHRSGSHAVGRPESLSPAPALFSFGCKWIAEGPPRFLTFPLSWCLI